MMCHCITPCFGEELYTSIFNFSFIQNEPLLIFIFSLLLSITVAFAFLGAVMFGSEISKYGQVTLLWGFILYVVGGVLLIASAASFLVEYCRLKHKEGALHLERAER